MPATPKMTKAKAAFTSHSKETGTSYQIYVDEPTSKGPHPVVFLMDGDFFFDHAVHASRTLAEEGKIPPTVVVGVGYGASFGQPGNYRVRDYTPTCGEQEPLSGSADKFLSYLTGTLWKEVAGKYSVKSSRRVVAGHSLGSLLVLYALFQKEPFFDMAVASAPSIFWDQRSILGLATKLRDKQASLNASVYLGVGEEETPSMLGDLGLLENQLRDRPFKGLTVKSGTFAGLDHFNSAGPILKAGLADLLG
jgi:predicted alpha/beta superfamily hydrolase